MSMMMMMMMMMMTTTTVMMVDDLRVKSRAILHSTKLYVAGKTPLEVMINTTC